MEVNRNALSQIQVESIKHQNLKANIWTKDG